MSSPKQLVTAKRPKRQTPRPLIDDLPTIDVRVLGRKKLFPNNWYDTNVLPDVGLYYPGVRSLTLTRAMLTVTLYNGQQSIPIKWYRPGLGGYRPIGKCACGRTAFRFHRIGSKLVCKYCTGGIYACQARDSETRPYIHAARIRAFIGGFSSVRGKFPPKPANMFFHTYNRLRAQCLSLEARLPHRRWRSKRVTERTLRPKHRYCTKAMAHMN